jgi:predicted molibdopterin-dependent oxidoreductase YjgC
MPRKASRPDQRIAEHPILTFDRGERLEFSFEGRKLHGLAGETVAAALVANGIKVFRTTEKLHRPRGFFCAVGKCSSCLMVVDGQPNTMVCMEPLRAGMKVERQHGRGRLP